MAFTRASQSAASSAALPVPLVCGLSTHQGGREQNEDASIWFATDDGVVAIVADGMGGGVDGKLFSDRAVARLQAHLISLGEEADQQGFVQALQQVVVELHALRQSTPHYQSSGTTLVAAWVRSAPAGVEAVIAHIGDSRAYHVAAGGKLRLLTIDHTYAEQLIRDQVPREEAYRHAQGHRLTHALGDNMDLADIPDLLKVVVLQPDDRLILCTDGVSKTVAPPQLVALAQRGTPQEAAEQITLQALRNGSKDNVTALVVHYPRRSPLAGRGALIALAAVVLALLVVGAFGAVGLAGSPSQTLPPQGLGGEATITPLPDRSVTPVPPTQSGASPVSTSTPGSTLTPTPTPVPTLTPTPIPVPTRTPARQPVIVPAAATAAVVPSVAVGAPEPTVQAPEPTPAAVESATAAPPPTEPPAPPPTEPPAPPPTEPPAPPPTTGAPMLSTATPWAISTVPPEGGP